MEAPLRRVIVLGGTGFFGRVIARRLETEGLRPVVASRRRGEIRIDVEDRASLERALRPADVLVDAAGPFHLRSTLLVEVAIARGCDVIDLSDSLTYAERILPLGGRIASAGGRVLTSCSAIAAVVAACVRASRLAVPDACDIFLAPASAETANPATLRAFLSSLGTMRTWRDGALVQVRGWSESRRFPSGARRGRLAQSAAALYLPRAWPSLRQVDLWVDPNIPLAAPALLAASRSPAVAAVVRASAPVAALVARRLGRRHGEFAVVVREAARVCAVRLSSPDASYLVAAEPAVLAASALARGEELPRGLVRPEAQVDPDVLFARLETLGVRVEFL